MRKTPLSQVIAITTSVIVVAILCSALIAVSLWIASKAWELVV